MSTIDDFDAIDALILSPKVEDLFPWTNHPEDHVGSEQFISRLYQSLNLKPPRFAWAPSPAAMYTAINMLRHIQAGQRHKFIEGLVRAEDIDGAAQRTVLEAIIDRTVTTTMGGCIKGMFPWIKLWQEEDRRESLWLTDLKGFLSRYSFIPQTVKSPFRGPAVNEVTLYSASYFVTGPLAWNTLSLVPYTHICWFCLPPVEAHIYDDGHLALMRFSDGYTVQLDHPEAEKELPAADLPALPGEVDDSPVATRSVLFAMCAMKKCEGCSGRIEDGNMLTTCSCECHSK